MQVARKDPIHIADITMLAANGQHAVSDVVHGLRSLAFMRMVRVSRVVHLYNFFLCKIKLRGSCALLPIVWNFRFVAKT